MYIVRVVFAVEKGVVNSHSGCPQVRPHYCLGLAYSKVVVFRLNEWTGAEGDIRLSIDDGPPAREFLDETYDEDDDSPEPADDEPLPFAIDHDNGVALLPPQNISGRPTQARPRPAPR